MNGHLYFIPQYRMERVDVFEDFIAAVAKLNQTDNPLIANSIYVIDDAKQRDKMTEEFYAAVKKEIRIITTLLGFHIAAKGKAGFSLCG